MESKQEGIQGVRISRLGMVSLGFGILSPLVPLVVGVLDPYFAITGVLGLAAGVAALVQIHRSKGGLKGRFYAVLGILTSGAWVGLILWRMVIPAVVEAREFAARRPTFEGASTELRQTVVTPTLDARMPAGTNVIWCLSFELAWDKLKDDAIKEPIRLGEANDLAQSLNDARVSESDVEAEDCYTAAGFLKDGIIEKIKGDMKARFPDVNVPEFEVYAPDDIITYAYLEASAKFRKPYLDYPYEFLFYDSHNHKTSVAAFGFWGSGVMDGDTAGQAEVLYYREGRVEDGNTVENAEFAVDLCRTSKPYSIVAAAVRPRVTLEETLAEVEREVEEYAGEEREPYSSEIDMLLVPDIFYSVGHHFEELEGARLVNAGFEEYGIIGAVQDVRFRLDKSGATLKSAAQIQLAALAKTPIECVFNRPFLVYMKKRGAERPFFVMWVDNAELLTKR